MALIYAKLSDSLVNEINCDKSFIHRYMFHNFFFHNIDRDNIHVTSICKGGKTKDDNDIFSNTFGKNIGCVIAFSNSKYPLSYFKSYEQYKRNIDLHGKDIYVALDVRNSFDGIKLTDYDFYVDHFICNICHCTCGKQISPFVLGINGVMLRCEAKEPDNHEDINEIMKKFEPSSTIVEKINLVLSGIHNGNHLIDVSKSYMNAILDCVTILDAYMIDCSFDDDKWKQKCEYFNNMDLKSNGRHINLNIYELGVINILATADNSYWLITLSDDDDSSVLRLPENTFVGVYDAKENFNTFCHETSKKYNENIYHIDIRVFGDYRIQI